MIAKATIPRTASDGAISTRHLGLLLARCRKRIWSAAHQELVKRGDTMWSWQVLAHLELCGALTQNGIATSTGQHPGATSRLLVDLEEQGLVRRRRDRKDQRRILVDLTKRGQAHLDRYKPLMESVTDRLFAGFTADDLTELQRLLRKLAGDADEAPDAGQDD